MSTFGRGPKRGSWDNEPRDPDPRLNQADARWEEESYGDSDKSHNDLPAGRRNREPERSDWESRLEGLSKYSNAETKVQASRVELNQRLVALIIDVFAAMLAGMVTSFIPLLNQFILLPMTMTLYLLVRDMFFDGRGLGKNLMGLQVVDVSTGRPCNFLQTAIRNGLIVGPLLVYYVVTALVKVIPNQAIAEGAVGILNLLGTVYTFCVIPYEAYLCYTSADGRRLGDKIAGTAIVESHMDFSHFLPRR